jgi:hypothetical protein
MKITRKQLRQIIQEELSLLESNDEDVDITVDQDAATYLDVGKEYYSQWSGGSYPSNMTEADFTNAHDMLKVPLVSGWVRFFNDLSRFGSKYLRGNLLALGYTHPDTQGIEVSKFFVRLRGILNKITTKKNTEFSHIAGLLNTLARLGAVRKETDK